MDAGQAADLPEGVAGTRLSSWILPNVDNETRGKLRPDILGLDSNTAPQENTTKYIHQIHKQPFKCIRTEARKFISLK